MAKKNYYAVKVGRKIDIFNTWEACKESVSGYPNAKYQGFATKEDAEAYLNISNVKEKHKKKSVQTIYESEDDNKIYYVVKKGRNSGLYSTWEECQAQTNGYRGAVFKKIQGKIAALRYINPQILVKKNKVNTEKTSTKCDKKEYTKKGYDVKAIKSKAKVKSSKNFVKPEDISQDYEFIAFVDGSYDKESKTYGSGVIILDSDGSYNTFSKSGIDEWDQWNIVGELEASKLAINKAKEFGVKNVAIYHDLKNIALWATGEWKAKNRFTQEYVKFIEEASKELNIYFVKVKGHSDESIYNDLADKAAKQAILDSIK